ncbi:GGDEF domain-containing protein [Rhodopseudomonas palustris]|nr:GGDEF domain-containing protein [Rhodopseudomonas palustris]OPF92761.1 GGDEF domain-containing protein [Rhodopseudomonas palustris]PPQ41902.1 GGDEF domain-containing protein [Rhodopseudomonas palustris]QLH73118.1 GGDEF domain-containing protein [Rhodopseudomonas palustris]RHZ92507.1 GGDEF domain-containing protein [Rhodopseudomonas palustris]RJF63958.1 GGDEF domain-containing protein [Rhodopseudomonas palustris]
MKKKPIRPSSSRRSVDRGPPKPAAKKRKLPPAGPRPAPATPRARVAGGRLPADPQLKIRRLKAQLAAALAQIDVLRACAETDFLLGIANRRGFERELGRALAYIKRYGAGGALIMLDVDRLKPVNDTLGHAAGDVVLKNVTEALLRHVRASDLIGRLGGDEFALLLWNLDETDARAKALGLEAAVDELAIRYGDQTIEVGISAGVAMLTPEMDAAEAFALADRAMYARKAERRAASGATIRR